ncbi:MAG: hypothetical protein C5B52_12945 [Bacteroidetes bacterium]|nr:MAG: hypothetical protein C5B52_12945 [Bacteroidota bacterium]
MPIARAGNDISITLPANSTGLNGSTSSDADGSVIAYMWRKISGPLTYTFNDSTLANPTVSNLKTGIYQFELTVTDNQGGIGKDTVKVTVINPFPNKLPVARAGGDEQLILPTSSAILDGSASTDSDGIIVSYLWTKIAGPASFNIASPTSATTTITGLTQGVYLFELKVTDDSSGVGRDTVKVTLSSTLRVLIDFGISTLTTASPDVNGNYWNNVTDTRPGNQLVNAISTVNTATTISLQVINRIDGTFAPSGTGTNGTNSTGVVNDYPANATNDFAFANSSTTTGKWRIYGLDSTKSYNIKFWGSKSAVTGRIIQIKRSDQTTWQSYDAGNNTDYNRAAVFTVSGLPEVSFDIQVQAGTFGYISVMDITSTNSGNQNPVAKAGNDITVTLPQDTVLLNGSASVDPDGTITKYKWRKIAGPAAGGITGNDSIPNPVVRNLVAGGAGIYSFELKVTDNGGLTGLDTVNVNVQNSGANLPPVAKAGSDRTIVQPADSVNLSGAGSFDTDGTISTWQWAQISGPGASTITGGNTATPNVKGLSSNAGTYAFQLTVTDNQGATGLDTVQVIVSPFPFTPPQVTDQSNCGKSFRIVVLGSSTAVGTGANPIDSSWVRKFTAYVKSKNSQNSVINIALGGATTYEVLNPTGFTPPTGRPAPDTAHNITKALSLNPDAIIINLPSNDVAAGYSVTEQKANYERTMALADASGIPVWVASAQPRNLTTQAARDSLKALRDWIFTRFGGKSVDFWTTIANADGTINPFFDSGDGTHVNNFGHHIFYVRMVGETILDSLCVITNKAPLAKAGNDTTITLPANIANLDGSTSNDPDGSIALYRWRKVAGPAQGTIADTTAMSTTVSGLVQGQYQFELRVVDNQGKIGRDTVQITVNPANIPPVARAGKDTLIVSPANSVMLDGSGSSDADGTITNYVWRELSGPTTYTIDDSLIATPTISSLVIGTYQLELSVKDNKGAIGKDTVNVFVNPVANILPVARAGNDTTIVLPPGTVNLDGSNSSDADGTIASYRWRKVSGTGGTIADTTAAQTSVTGLTAGTYQFALIVTDNVGGIGRDTMMVTVNNPPNIPPVAVAGNDTLITLPANVISLKGSQSSDPDGTISTYRWKKISGPATGTITDTTAAQTTATGLVAGTYQFELTVTDNVGAKSKDTMAAIINQPPVANAGTNATITLPINSVQLDGSASSDPDGSITGYLWAYVSGPATYTLNSNVLASPMLSNLVQGTYIFSLTVTDNRGATASAQVTITVNAQVIAGARTRVLIDAGPSTSTTPSPDTWGKYWNNMTDGRAGVRVSNAVDTANRPTTVSIEVINRIDGTYATSYPGTNGGNTTGIVGDYPASATNDFIFAHESTTTGKWRLFGLDPNSTYSVKFWGAKSYPSARIIRIKRSDQSTWQSYDGQNNTDYNRAAVFSVTGLTEVSFDIQVQSGTFGYINVIDIVGVANSGGAGARTSYVTTSTMMAQPDQIAPTNVDKVDVYPNPVISDAQLMIQNNYRGPVRVTIRNQYGRALRQISVEKIGTDVIQNITMNDLPKGVYFIQLNYGQKSKTVKFVKY